VGRDTHRAQGSLLRDPLVRKGCSSERTLTVQVLCIKSDQSILFRMEHEAVGRQPVALEGLIRDHGGSTDARYSSQIIESVWREVEHTGDDRVLSCLAGVDRCLVRIEMKLMAAGVWPTVDPPLRCRGRSMSKRRTTHLPTVASLSTSGNF
jgi:hypothetical protein